MLFNTIYVGYFVGWGSSYIMCISDNINIVRGYLQKIRCLNKHEIEIDEVTLDEATMFALYEDFIIEEYIDGIYLTRRDIEYLDNMVKEQMKEFVNVYKGLSYWRDIVASIDGKIAKDVAYLDPAIARMEKRLTSAKALTKVQKQLIYSSDVLSPSITRYMALMGSVAEDKEMREMFLNKMEDPRA